MVHHYWEGIPLCPDDDNTCTDSSVVQEPGLDLVWDSGLVDNVPADKILQAFVVQTGAVYPIARGKRGAQLIERVAGFVSCPGKDCAMN